MVLCEVEDLERRLPQRPGAVTAEYSLRMSGMQRGRKKLGVDGPVPRPNLRPEREPGNSSEVHETPIYFNDRSKLRTIPPCPDCPSRNGVSPPRLRFGVASH